MGVQLVTPESICQFVAVAAGGASPPSAPVISLTSFTDTTIVVSWSAVAGATSYNLYKGGVLVGAATSPATASGLTASTSYDITVTAVGAGGESAPSNTVTQTTRDTDAQAFITAASLSDATQMAAVNTLVVALKGYSIWTKFFAIYPFVGGTSTTHKFNLKNPSDTDGAFRIVWNGTVTHDANGVQGNGSTGWGDTKFAPNGGNWTLGNASLGVYVRNNAATGYDFASNDSTLVISRYTATTTYYGRHAGSSYVTTSNADSRGFHSVNVNSTTLTQYKNGSSVNSASISTTSLASATMGLCANNAGGSRTEWSTHQLAFAYLGSTLNATEQGDLYTAVQAFQTSLGRNV